MLDPGLKQSAPPGLDGIPLSDDCASGLTIGPGFVKPGLDAEGGLSPGLKERGGGPGLRIGNSLVVSAFSGLIGGVITLGVNLG